MQPSDDESGSAALAFLREALGSATANPPMWFSAVFSLIAAVAAAAVVALIGWPAVIAPAAVVAMFASIGAAMVPSGLTLQVGGPTWAAIAAALPLALLSEYHPLAAALIAAGVMAVGAVSQADVPVGAVAGLLGPMVYVLALATRLVRPETPAVAAAVATGVGIAAGAAAVGLLMLLRRWAERHGARHVPPRVPTPPPGIGRRWWTAVSASLTNWRQDPFVRLALRRVLVISPLVFVLQSWGEPAALYGLLAAFAVTQPTLRETGKGTLARIAGTLLACFVAVAVGLVLPPAVMLPVGLVAMAAGLAYLRRNKAVATIGTTVFALSVATAAGASVIDSAEGRFLATAVGALIGLLATVLLPPPGQQAAAAARSGPPPATP